MGNSKFAIRNYFLKPHVSGLKPAFTLVEMLVAVAMGAALIAAAAGVFALASQAVNTSQANTDIHTQLRILFSWLDRDFARIRLDGPLVIIPQESDLGSGENVRIDQMYFLISGDIRSMDAPNYSASLAIISYGPDDIIDYAPLEPPYHWVFTRRATLIVSDPAASGTDLQQSSFAQLMVEFFAGDTSGAWGPALTKPDLTDNDELPTYLLGNVVSFRIVRYYMAGETDPDEIEQADVGTPIPFGPQSPKPAWIDFEITLRDANNRLDEDFVATYRVNLPSR